MSEEIFQSFTITYEALNERETFSCGDVIIGEISFKLCEEIKVSSIMFDLKGEANVMWSIGSGKNRRTYSAREEYFKIKEILLAEDNHGVGDGNTVLQEGTHVYPFRVQLPQGNFPSSFKGIHGNVVYFLEVQIHRPWRLAKEFRSEFNFVSDIEANHPQLVMPQTASSTKGLYCLCCVSGPISVGVRLEKKGFIPGEMMKIIAEFENCSSRTLVPRVKLAQTQTFYTRTRMSKRCETRYLALIEGKHLMPHSCDVWDNQMLQVPADTPLTISNCQIIEVEYSLVVHVSIPRGVDLKATVPLVICRHCRGNETAAILNS
ncbi:hypothetical protein SKAU_G00013530 [Synaphobranchus kaupii]|uniref:Arrestin C-terminal-like domain-containing protein n=1 Tax=Synaphobranchus kaupii TaxID=118154 RepID=A0A9Q1GBL1_SYNKA|nr:hypothetical protein SKAU_G00013530 [Synaphobranchus kaupii]